MTLVWIVIFGKKINFELLGLCLTNAAVNLLILGRENAVMVSSDILTLYMLKNSEIGQQLAQLGQNSAIWHKSSVLNLLGLYLSNATINLSDVWYGN